MRQKRISKLNRQLNRGMWFGALVHGLQTVLHLQQRGVPAFMLARRDWDTVAASWAAEGAHAQVPADNGVPRHDGAHLEHRAICWAALLARHQRGTFLHAEVPTADNRVRAAIELSHERPAGLKLDWARHFQTESDRIQSSQRNRSDGHYFWNSDARVGRLIPRGPLSKSTSFLFGRHGPYPASDVQPTRIWTQICPKEFRNHQNLDIVHHRPGRIFAGKCRKQRSLYFVRSIGKSF